MNTLTYFVHMLYQTHKVVLNVRWLSISTILPTPTLSENTVCEIKLTLYSRYNSVKKDNSFVYHEKVPTLDSLPEVKG